MLGQREIKRTVLTLAATSVVSLYFMVIMSNGVSMKFSLTSSRVKEFEEWELDSLGRNIFFVETNADVERFGARLDCAFESAALFNKDHIVFVLVNADNTENKRNVEMAEHLRQIPNLYFRTLNFSKFIEGTVLEDLWKSGKVQRSEYVLVHLSDLFRLLLLHRFGGVYLDTDTISLTKLPTGNFLTFLSRAYVSDAVMQFTQPGHIFLQTALDDLARDFRGDVWAHQGPGLATRTAKRFCNWIPLNNAGNQLLQCDSFDILPITAAFAVSYLDWRHFLSPKYNYYMKNMNYTLQTSIASSFATHYWNQMLKMAGNETFYWNKKMPIVEVMSQVCPQTFASEIIFLYGQKFE